MNDLAPPPVELDAATQRVLDMVVMHPGSAVFGVEADAVQAEFLRSGTASEFGQALSVLMRWRQLDVVPDAEPPRLRPSGSILARLSAEFDAQCAAGQSPPPVFNAASSTIDHAAQHAADAQLGESTQADRSAETVGGAADHGVTSEALITEYALRNAVLGIFGSKQKKAGSSMAYESMRQLWSSEGHAIDELPVALSIACRDGELSSARRGLQEFFTLTRDGEAYLRGAMPPPQFLDALSPYHAADLKLDTMPDGPLMRHLIDQFSPNRPSQSHDNLRASWMLSALPECSLLHGLDLLLRDDFLRVESGRELGYRMTDDGAVFLKRARSLARRLDTRRALNKADRVSDRREEY